MLRKIALAALLFTPVVTAQETIVVQVAPFSELAIGREFNVPAEVLSANHARIAAEVDAVITAIHADVGEIVEQGSLLLQLDTTDYQLNLQLTQANLGAIDARIQQARARLNRAEELSGKQYVSPDELLARQTDVKVLRAQRKSAEINVATAKRELDKTRITAPFKGVVVARSAQLGSYSSRGGPLLELVQLESPELEAELYGLSAEALTAARELTFTTQRGSWPVELLRLSPVLESANRIQRARLGFVADAAAIGSSGELVWQAPGQWLPADYVQRRDGIYGVFVWQQQSAEFIPLPNAQEGRPALTPFAAETLIVTSGRERLQPGDRLRLDGSGEQ